MNRKKFFCLMSTGVFISMLTGCSSVHETDGSGRLVIGLMRENNQRTRSEAAWGKGGFLHGPDTVSLYRGNQPSAAVMGVFGRSGPILVPTNNDGGQ